MDFKEKRVLVTGGTRGIGRATVEAFLSAGARVAVNGRSEQSTARALAELAAGTSVIAAPGNIGLVSDCQRVVETAIYGLGGLDVLVNNAGVGEGGTIEECDEEMWDRIANVNLKGTFFCTKFTVSALRKSKGSIVNISSVLGIRGSNDGDAIYCATKGGVVNLTRSLAAELGPDIRVNCLCPGAIDTDMLQEVGKFLGDGDVAAGYEIMSNDAPLRRVARAAEIANAILYLASDMASFVTGSIHVVDGGLVAAV